ncbi:hypothetical protein BCT46_15735 [Vibrio sp. 10N.261.46.E8]|nr:hypothetical protein BH584_05555 [Vibrio sp. 10N.261.45.E1]PMJ34405.1 hypothetical protein BCU27_02980 [Vibrio sp. 10N.286.45.B6]PML86776.1 hypothetical protein BCT66_00685 [Vibrio sp. 10N.261.49.E11]PMM76776.1 hypothetical protein BCT48_24560 [Vibrio sp. 10N.261.46.F12]PMM81856.1 hypothetical protein BCT46_15735 [Vibrio sp. 10N.261.46.E8]PMN80470.1 hypothetical protein BCT25_15530 [Vibrio sp. 10N.261.45.A6]PMN83694.1 hypothetical protein BCT22_11820 [Vibrio sp. 10N.261.45.A1]
MSYKSAHKRKIKAKKFGRHLVRYTVHCVGDPLFMKRPGTGKNKVHTKVIGIMSKGKSGSSILERIKQQDLADGGNRLEQVIYR